MYNLDFNFKLYFPTGSKKNYFHNSVFISKFFINNFFLQNVSNLYVQAERREAVTEFVEECMRRFIPEEYLEREQTVSAELMELAGSSHYQQNNLCLTE